MEPVSSAPPRTSQEAPIDLNRVRERFVQEMRFFDKRKDIVALRHMTSFWHDHPRHRIRWTADKEKVALLLLELGYPANALNTNGRRVDYNQAWHAVDRQVSSLYLLRCFGDLGSKVIEPMWLPALSENGRVGSAYDLTYEEMEQTRKEKIDLLKDVWNDWSTKEHKDFPRAFRTAVFSFLLVRNRDPFMRFRIAPDICKLIFRQLARVWCEEQRPHWGPPLVIELLRSNGMARQLTAEEIDARIARFKERLSLNRGALFPEFWTRLRQTFGSWS
jgi:hypothetical protein